MGCRNLTKVFYQVLTKLQDVQKIFPESLPTPLLIQIKFWLFDHSDIPPAWTTFCRSTTLVSRSRPLWTKRYRCTRRPKLQSTKSPRTSITGRTERHLQTSPITCSNL